MSQAGPINTDSFFRLPRRIFLDTCVVNLMLDFADVLHDGLPIPDGLPEQRRREVEALCGIFDTGTRALWRFTISARTHSELAQTTSEERRRDLLQWFAELWHYQSEFSRPRSLSRSTLGLLRRQLQVLPDRADKDLILDALRDRCDAFCTVDRRTILNHRPELPELPIRILTPSEWWAEILPWAATWV